MNIKQMTLRFPTFSLPFLLGIGGGILFVVSIFLYLNIPESGLIVTYYDNPNWEGEPVLTQQENLIRLDTSRQLQDEGKLPATNFSMKWEGWIRIDKDSDYHLMTASDDGSSVFLDDRLVLDNGGFHPRQKVEVELALKQGIHKISINYFNGAGAAEFVFYIGRDRQGAPDVPVSANAFYPTYPTFSETLKWAIYAVVGGWSLLLTVAFFGGICHLSGQFRSLPLIILIVFFVSSHLAWLNPGPGFKEKHGHLVKPSERIPFLWQYNQDAHIELASAAYFPSYFRTNPMRVNRPSYPLLVCILGKTAGFVVSPFVPFINLDTEEEAMVGYVVLKLIIYSLGGILMFHLLLPYCQKFCAFYAVALLFFHHFSLEYMAIFHTTELQFISPIFVLFLFYSLANNYSVRKNMLFSFLVGGLMLAKQNYATYLAILLYSLWHRRFKAVGISVMTHALPLLAWLGFLYFYGVEYYNHEAAVYSQGTWLYKEFIHLNMLQMAQVVIQSLFLYVTAITRHYWIWGFVAAAGVAILLYHDRKRVEIPLILLSFCMTTTWLQCFAAGRYRDYMTADFSIFLFAISSYAVCHLIKKKSWLYILLIGWLFINILQFVNFPWIHPYNQ